MDRKILIIAIFLTCVSSVTNAQNITKYYNSKYEEVPENKARYVKVAKTNPDGSVTTEETDLKKGALISSSTMKDGEPYGVWIGQSGRLVGSKDDKRDYDFPLVYASDECDNSSVLPARIDNYFNSDGSAKYLPPKIGGANTIFEYLGKNTRYPEYAKENGLEGRVYAQFTVDTDGSVSNVSIVRGVHVSLDKEVARLVREMKFEEPAKVDGKPVKLCVRLPVSFKLG